MTDAYVTAEKLLQAGAVKLSPQQPFTWASGWKSPIYCDNRRLLSQPYIRDYIKSELCNIAFEIFDNAEVIAGVATAGIPWAAMVADQLKLPLIYVRPKPKEHGLGNLIEGYYEQNQKVLVVEDLVSTGKSSLQVVDVLRSNGLMVEGMVSIFNYLFIHAVEAFKNADVTLQSLTDYPTLLKIAMDKGLINEAEHEILLKWRSEPQSWTGVS